MCIQAVLGARESLEGCFEVLQPQLAAIDCTWEDFLWAVQVGVVLWYICETSSAVAGVGQPPLTAACRPLGGRVAKPQPTTAPGPLHRSAHH